MSRLKRKRVANTSFLFFMAGVIMTSTTNAQSVRWFSIDLVPIQTIEPGWWGNPEGKPGPVTTLSTVDTRGDENFRALVILVTGHVAARLTRENLSLANAKSKERSLLQFLYWPLPFSEDKPPAPVPPLDMRPTISGCRISSPWIDIAFERKPVPWIRAIVRWNERQLLTDQAILAGAKNVPQGIPKLLKTQRELADFMGEYSLWADPPIFHSQTESHPVSLSTTKPIEEHVPPDLLWLFRRSNPRGSLPTSFINSVDGSRRKAMTKGAENYTKLVNALIDRCFASDGANLQYSNILDAADLIPLKEYKIDMPLY